MALYSPVTAPFRLTILLHLPSNSVHAGDIIKPKPLPESLDTNERRFYKRKVIHHDKYGGQRRQKEGGESWEGVLRAEVKY